MSNKSAPVISLAGWSGSGKTTFQEQVVERLSNAGIRVGVIKHHGHSSSVDVEGKDTWRYKQAGASPVIVSSAAEFAIIRKVEGEKTLTELVAMIEDECDVILTEGFKNEAHFLVEFQRSENSVESIYDMDLLKGLVSDREDALEAAKKAGVPTFALDDIEGFSAFVARTVGCELS